MTETTSRGFAYRAWTRALVGGLLGLAAGSLFVILAVVIRANDPPVTPGDLVRMMADWSVLPAILGFSLRRVFRADVAVDTSDLVIQRRDARIDVPLEAIAAVRPWALPVPGPGMSIVLRSGRRLADGRLALRDPAVVLAALAAASVPSASAALAHPTIRWAAARALRPARRWVHRAGKFLLFALVPTLPLFNVHQHISYGAFLGEYYLLGLGSWLATFGVYWLTLTLYLVLWAALWRAVAEIVTLGAAYALPGTEGAMRRAVEGIATIAFYGGVPLLVALRFVPW